jgi:hypothetical protein
MSEVSKLLNKIDGIEDEPKEPTKKTVSVFITVKRFERFKQTCASLDTKIGEVLDALMTDFCDEVEKKRAKK